MLIYILINTCVTSKGKADWGRLGTTCWGT